MRALIVVDIQNDFMPGGALSVPHGEETVPVANLLMDHFDIVVATQDWHPKDHSSFVTRHPGSKVGDVIEVGGLPQVVWPVHCVAGTRGAAFHPALNVGKATIFHKGVLASIDSYSGFFDNGHKRATGLGDFLREKAVGEVFVLGVATDYCVKLTALDAVREGFKTRLIEDGCRGVNLHDGDVVKAITAMREAGIAILNSHQLVAT